MAFTTNFSGDYEDQLQNYSATQLKRAEALANQPYEAYAGDRIAGRSDAELAAIENVRNLATSGLGYDQVQQASDIMSDLGGYEAGAYNANLMRDQDIAAYMNPFLQGALDPALRSIREEQTSMLQGMSGAAARAGAFGGSRHGVAQSELMKGYGQQLGDVIGKGYYSAYQDAQNLAQGDVERLNQEQLIQEANRLSAANVRAGAASGLSQVANQMREQGYTDAEIVRALEQEERAMRQAELDVAYGDYQAEQAFPYQQLQAALAPLGLGAQVATAAPTVDDPSYLQNLLGGVGYTADLLGNLGKAGITYSDFSGGVSDIYGDIKDLFS